MFTVILTLSGLVFCVAAISHMIGVGDKEPAGYIVFSIVGTISLGLVFVLMLEGKEYLEIQKKQKAQAQLHNN